MISQKAKYALRALIELARAKEGDAQLITDIASHQRIPKKFLEQILLDLKHDGLVYSRRGRNGGYGLLKDPCHITFGQIMRIIDGPMAPLPCLSRMAYRRCEDCHDETICEIRRVFSRAYDQSAKILDSTTLADALINRPKDLLTDGEIESAERVTA
ncbi:putative HTH-type transcriptional regulator rrf2-like [alpha proteobacterium Q-1]|nr:putative HTH-type transcriptional regulator rrf2-like [alpha proteobacterium Q-1]